VEALADEARADYWMTDITTSAFSEAISSLSQADTMQSLRHVQASDCLPGEQILDTVHRHGWRTEARRSYLTDMAFAAGRIQRMMGDRPSAAPRIPPDDPTGVHLFGRA
jgi:hypothetical protein